MRLTCILQAQSHYEVLGLPKNASQRQIKTKFYQLSKQLHPDRTRTLDEPGQKDASEKYRKITEAYDILSDDAKKREYDSRGTGGSGTGSSTHGTHTYNPYKSTRNARDATADDGHGRSGFNRMKSRVFNYGRDFKKPGSSPLDPGQHKGSNYDVPHFDYDRHLQQQRSYEDHRRRADKLKYERKKRAEFAEAFDRSTNDTPSSGGLVTPGGIVAVALTVVAFLWYK